MCTETGEEREEEEGAGRPEDVESIGIEETCEGEEKEDAETKGEEEELEHTGEGGEGIEDPLREGEERGDTEREGAGREDELAFLMRAATLGKHGTI